MAKPTLQPQVSRPAARTTWQTRVAAPEPNEQLAQLRGAARAFAHEIRNPLNGAQLHLTFLQRELGKLGASEDAVEATRVIAHEIKRIAGLVSHFLESSGPPARTRVSLRELCLRAVQLIAGDAERAGVEVGTELDSADCTVEVDWSRMEQLLLHLLERAVAAAVEAGGKVVIRARRDAGDAVIQVKHDGSPKTTLVDALLSEPDSDVSSSSLALRILADHGGSIEVKSEPGRTEFRVKVPLHAATLQASGVASIR